MKINYLAVFVATVASMVFGWAWYGLVFGERWCALLGKTMAEMQNVSPTIYLWPFLSSLVGAVVLGWILPKLGSMSLMNGIKYSLLIAIPFTLLCGLTTNAFSMRPFELGMIDQAHNVLQYVLIGAIMGAMPKK